MKTLQSVLEKSRQDIISLTQNFGFKNIHFLFDDIESPVPLNLVVDVDDSLRGDSNNTYLLEAKLMNALGIDVVVIVGSEVTNFFSQEIVKSKTISVESTLKEIQDFLKKPLNDLYFKDQEISSNKLKRHLDLADLVLKEKYPKTAFFQSATTAISSQVVVDSDKINELLSFLEQLEKHEQPPSNEEWKKMRQQSKQLREELLKNMRARTPQSDSSLVTPVKTINLF